MAGGNLIAFILMKKLLPILIIIPILILGSFLLFKSKLAEPTSASVSRTGLILDLNFGNNNGQTDTIVYDASGYGRHATSTAGASPACGQKFCDFDGSNDNLTANGTGVFNHPNYSWVVKFSPDFEANDGNLHFIFDAITGIGHRNGISKIDTNTLRFHLRGGTFLIPLATYQPYWKVGKENIIIVTSNSIADSHNAWLNGVKILDNDTTNLTAGETTKIAIGKYSLVSSYFFNGKLYYLKMWNRLLGENEVANLSADRETTVSAPPRTGLVGYWNMDANDIYGTTIYDKSGYNASSTLIAAPVGAAGKIKQALDFDGAAQYIMSTSTAFDVNYFTLSAWVKMDNAPDATSNQYIIQKGDDTASTLSYSLNIVNSAPDYLVCKRGNGTSQSSSGSGAATAFSNFKSDRYYHLVCVYDTDNKIKIYVDGAFKDSAAHTGTTLVSASELKIGYGTFSSNNRFFNGKIDDARIFNRALSAQEIANLYNSAKSNYIAAPPREGLVGYWNMDSNDSTATKVYDKSGQNNYGAPNGFYTGLAPTSTPGKINQAIDFDGSNGSISVPDSASLDIFNAITVSIWVKADALDHAGGGNNARVIDKGGGGAYILYITNTGIIVFSLIGVTDNSSATAAGVFKTGQWFHISGVYDSATGIRDIYINGVANSSAHETGLTGTISNGGNLIIGDNGTKVRLWDGAIDDVRIYNRALSAQEIMNLYRSSTRQYIK